MDNNRLMCVRCVMDQTDPDIQFDQHGICNYCHAAKAAANQHRIDKMNLPWIIDYIKKRGRGKKYDVLLGLSGGVDSSTALRVIREHGLRPLTYQVDNGWNTPEADENVMRLVEGLKVPFYRYTINLERFRELQRAFIMSGTANIEVPTDHILMATTYEMAAKYKIPTVISGGNFQTESIMPPAWGYNARDLTFIEAVYKEFTGKKLKGLPTISLLKYLWYRNIKRIQVINLLDYCEYNREEEQKRLAKMFGWKPYGEKHAESVFTQWFQIYYLPMRFGYDKRKPHLSSLIHSGQMTREEAIHLLKFSPDLKVLSVPLDPLGVQWRPEENKTYRDYRNAEKWWDRWSAFFRFLKKFGYSA